MLRTTPPLFLPGDDSQGPTLSPCYPGPSLSITTTSHQIFKWHLRLCHYPQGVEQAAQEEGSPHFHGRSPERWIPLERSSRVKVGCSLSPSKVSRPPAVVAVSPRKQTRSPKVSFLLPHSCVYSAAVTGLYHSRCSLANPSLFGLQPLCSPAPLWMHQRHSDKFDFYFAKQQPCFLFTALTLLPVPLQLPSHCFASRWIVP